MINEKDYEYKITAAGRVNIIGEHIDYCGGKVFPAALSFKNTVYVRRNGTDKINLSWTTLKDKVSLDINNLNAYKNLKYGNYQAGCALFLKDAGHKVIGCDMIQDCTVPFGSGLSSSAAIEVSTIKALSVIAGEEIDNVSIALLGQKAEREYAGMNCGIMDQYASACGKKGYAMLLDCKTLNCEYVPFDLHGYSLVITNCNKPHSLVESKYNERRSEAEEALSKIQTKTDISCLADLSVQDFNKYSYVLSGKIYDRAKHIVEECARVAEAKTAMQTGDILLLGKLLNASHDSLRDLYETTGFEPDALVDSARESKYCIGSRLTGGGFGGCTVSLVKKGCEEEFKNHVSKSYELKTGYKPSFYDSDIADGLTVTKL